MNWKKLYELQIKRGINKPLSFFSHYLMRVILILYLVSWYRKRSLIIISFFMKQKLL